MNAEQVVEKILSQARAEAEAILGQARQKAAQADAQLEAELAEFDRKTEQLAEAAGQDRWQRMLAAARMDNARRLLAARTAILDEVFAKARQALCQMPDAPYQALMADLMTKAVETGDEEVVIGRGETRIHEPFLAMVNSRLGPDRGRLRLCPQRGDFEGGFILRRQRVQINASAEVLVDRLRDAMEMELAGMLFGTD
ncbi:MAG TPA: V-type ATP synthase subunit E [Anaerohalosphaeraceae bacterium]|nr:V-type ATP synthase subunit E [Phycisphaerae bacterium]HOK96583.1 V-type ATP synthase subunit E [Anaerohalosphaeraceae bacterium]HOL32275.1 V-type ATP synthase subunit E [Anaerohalosphaeraceae bacterium]HOM77046.1 V-type ATP synthase subunit E [Anaerohalosphaeraceae bacterium]HPC65551.1 V-type ATP synthase subunit E [Anaerohalosphaeraceae bacterium]